jgi:hypothetical protein
VIRSIAVPSPVRSMMTRGRVIAPGGSQLQGTQPTAVSTDRSSGAARRVSCRRAPHGGGFEISSRPTGLLQCRLARRGRMPDGTHHRPRLTRCRGCADRLGDPDEVALAVVEECAQFPGAAAGRVIGAAIVSPEAPTPHTRGAQTSHAQAGRAARGSFRGPRSEL